MAFLALDSLNKVIVTGNQRKRNVNVWISVGFNLSVNIWDKISSQLNRRLVTFGLI